MEALSKRYANALYHLTEDNNELADLRDQAYWLKDILRDEAIWHFITHPEISPKEKHHLIDDTLRPHCHDNIIDTLHVMIDNYRSEAILAMLEAYITQLEARLQMKTCYVGVAMPLSPREEQSLKEVLQKKFPHQHLTFKMIVDPRIIGGFYIRVDEKLYDHTVRRELTLLKQHLVRKEAMHATD